MTDHPAERAHDDRDRDPADDGRPGVGRVEAFSDGVIAIIITIMVLELHPPLAEGWDKLAAQWPVFFAYVLSYAYVAIYWVNHHQLFGFARRVSNALIWSNILLLFALSLVPFSTSYLGEQHFTRTATWVYLATMIFPGLVYIWLQATIARTGQQSDAARDYHATSRRKAAFGTALYLLGALLTIWSPWAGAAAAGLVAVLWFLPAGPLDRLFAR